jgi:hypothetical protein
VLPGTPKTIRSSVFKMQHAPTHFLKLFPLRKTGPSLFAGKDGFLQYSGNSRCWQRMHFF